MRRSKQRGCGHAVWLTLHRLFGNCCRPDLGPGRGGSDLLENGLAVHRPTIVWSICGDDDDASGL